VRILVVSSYPPRHCGIGAYAAALVEKWRKAGDRVVVVSPPDGDGQVRVGFDHGRPFFRAASMGGWFDRIVVHFQPALYYRPRASLSKVLASVGLLWLVVRRPQTEFVVHEADRPIWWRPDYAILRQAFTRARLLFHTDAERRELERKYRLRARSRLIDHTQGIRVRGPASREEARRRLDVGAEERLFVCAGFLHPDKGFERAVRAFGEAGSPGRLVIVGSVRDHTPANDGYAAMLRDLCRRTPGVTLLKGYASDQDFDAWIAAADRLVVPYRVSWSSGALARARAIGTRAIVSDAGGLPEQAGDGDTVFHSDSELAALLREPNAAAAADDRVEIHP
jgi:glycosyltransferase involved in cell wall biosynthesis